MANYKGPLDYIDVATRIIEFREKFPHGSLQSWKDPYVIEVKMPDGSIKSYMVYSAAAYRSPDDSLPGVGWAYEPIPGARILKPAMTHTQFVKVCTRQSLTQ
jgi:hypothetical protein